MPSKLHSSILFPALKRELTNKPHLIGNLKGLFIVTILKRGKKRDEWFLLFNGRESAPIISQTRPPLPSHSSNNNSSSSASSPSDSPNSSSSSSGFPVVLVDIDDSTFLTIMNGGITGIKAYTTGKVNVVGDLLVAQQALEVFAKAGGVERVKEIMSGAKNSNRSKAKL